MSSNQGAPSSAGRRLTPLAVALMLMMCFSWGFNQIAIKLALPDIPSMLRAMIRSTPVNGFIGCAAALADHDFRSAVATVTRPLLFIVGEKDGPQPAAMRDMHQKVPGSGYVELAGAGHISNMDQPAQFSAAIAQFLA